MILSDSQIKKYLQEKKLVVETISPYDVLKQIGPASLDFRLGDTFTYYEKGSLTLIDPKKNPPSTSLKSVVLDADTPFILHPGQFVLGVTLEKIKIPYDLVARCEGRSSIGRLGVLIHSTAGYIDPGFEGTITLEITNINEIPVALYPGMRIGQFAFETLFGEVEIPYDKRRGSKYMGQIKPQPSKIDTDLY